MGLAGETRLNSIHLVQENEPLRIQKIILYPYPDLTRLWYRLRLEGWQDVKPNIDIGIWDRNGDINNSLSFVAYDDPFLDATIHLKEPAAGMSYLCTTEVSTGMPPDVKVHDAIRFDFPLEFRDAQQGVEGFGYDRPSLSL